MKSVLDNAPSHWERTTIGEIAEVRLGRQRSPKNHSGDHMRPYLRAANVDWYRLRLDDVQEMNFTDDEMVTFRLQDGDVLVVEGSGSATEVGKCGIYQGEVVNCAFQNTLIRVRPRGGVDSRWLMYRINAEAELGGFLQMARGVGIFHLGSTRASRWPVAVPPLDEQIEAAALMDRLTSRLDAALTALGGVARRGDVLDRSVLSAACEGRLLDGGSTGAHDVLDELEVPNEQRSPHRCAAWAWAPLGAIAQTALGKMLSKDVRGGEDPVPYLRNENVQWGRIGTDDLYELTLKPEEVERYSVRPNDLLVCEGGEAGRCAIWRGGIDTLYFQKALHRVRPREGVSVEWLALALEYVVRTERHSHLLTGTTIEHLPQEKLRRLLVPIAPPDLQPLIVEKVEQLRSIGKQVARDLRTVRQRRRALRRASLKAIFEGRVMGTVTAASPTSERVGVLR